MSSGFLDQDTVSVVLAYVAWSRFDLRATLQAIRNTLVVYSWRYGEDAVKAVTNPGI